MQYKYKNINNCRITAYLRARALGARLQSSNSSLNDTNSVKLAKQHLYTLISLLVKWRSQNFSHWIAMKLNERIHVHIKFFKVCLEHEFSNDDEKTMTKLMTTSLLRPQFITLLYREDYVNENVLVCWVAVTQHHGLGSLKTEICFPIVLQARRPRLRHQ